jgi:hypothetical protein
MLNLKAGKLSCWILLSFPIPHSLAQSDATVSIQDDPSYSLIRTCAKCPLYGCGWDDVNSLLEAQGYNQLYCRADFSATVNAYLSSSISSVCTPKPVTDDISSVIGLYSKYCKTALDPVTAAAAPEASSSTNPAAPAASTSIASYTGSPVTSTTTDYSAATSTSDSGQSLGAVGEWPSLLWVTSSFVATVFLLLLKVRYPSRLRSRCLLSQL